jgi:hypothetical protein
LNPLQKCDELFHAQAGVANEPAQQPAIEFPMVGDRTIRRDARPRQNHMVPFCLANAQPARSNAFRAARPLITGSDGTAGSVRC